MNKLSFRPNFPLVNELSETPANLVSEEALEQGHLRVAVEERARLFPIMQGTRFLFEDFKFSLLWGNQQ